MVVNYFHFIAAEPNITWLGTEKQTKQPDFTCPTRLPDILAFHLYEAEADAAFQVLLHICCLHLPSWIETHKSGIKLNRCWLQPDLCCLLHSCLTPCPKAFVNPTVALWLFLKNWWVKCWAIKANIRLVPWGSGLNSRLLKYFSQNSLGSGRLGLPVNLCSVLDCIRAKWLLEPVKASPLVPIGKGQSLGMGGRRRV